MLHQLLFPSKFKVIGWTLLVPSAIIGLISVFSGFEILQFKASTFAFVYTGVFGQNEYFSLIETEITNTIVGSLFIIGALMVGFSKERKEDEFIAKLRLSSLMWAVWVNYALLLVSFLFIYGAGFLSVMLYNMFTVLIIFIARFNYILYRSSKSVPDEE